MENNKVFTLTNDSKISFFFHCHQQFLPTDHKYRKNIKYFFVGRVKKDVAPPVSLGEELYGVVLQCDDIVFGFQSSKQEFRGCSVNYN
jgi:hypothetical protein